MGNRSAAIAAVLLVACSHHDDAPKAAAAPSTPSTDARAPSPDAAAVAAPPDAAGPVTVIRVPGFLFGVGAEGPYFGRVEPDSNFMLERGEPAIRNVVLGNGIHGFAMTDDFVYWTDPGRGSSGGVWRAKRPWGDAEQIVSGSNLPEKIVVLGKRLVYWEGGVLLAVGLDGGSPSPLAELNSVAFAMVADDRAVYWVGGKDPSDSRLGEVTAAGAAKTIAKLDGVAKALAVDDTSLFVAVKSPKGIKVVSLPKRGGAMTTWAEGAFDDRTLVVSGGAVVLLDADLHTVQRVASPGAAPELLYTAEDGTELAGLVVSGGRLYTCQRAPDH
jgi:hypothetical protein